MRPTSSQTEEDLEEEFLDDPIKLFFEEDRASDCEIVDADVIDLESEWEDSDLDVGDISQIDNSNVFERFSTSPLPHDTPAIKDIKVKIVDCHKYPWYYKKHFVDITKHLNNISVSDKSGIDSVSVKQKSVDATKNCEMRSTQQKESVKKSRHDALSDLTLKIKYNADKKGWTVEKRLETLKRREDIEIRKAISQRNSDKIDFKRNKGLIGLTITPRIIVDENSVAFARKDKLNKKLKESAEKRNGKQLNVSETKSNPEPAEQTSTNVYSTIANTLKDNVVFTHIDTEPCKQNTIDVDAAAPLFKYKSSEVKEQIVEFKNLKCSLKIAPEKIISKLKLIKASTKHLNKDKELQSDYLKQQTYNKEVVELNFVKNGKKATKLVHVRKPVLSKNVELKLNSGKRKKKSLDDQSLGKKPVSDKVKLMPKSNKATKLNENVAKGRHSVNSNLKSVDKSQKNLVTNLLETKCNATNIQIVDKEANMVIQDTRKIINDQARNINPLPKKPHIAPISSTYMQHLSNNYYKPLSPPSLNKEAQSVTSSVQSKYGYKSIADVGDVVATAPQARSFINSSSFIFPYIPIHGNKPRNLKIPRPPQSNSKQNISVHIVSKNLQNSANYTRTTVGNQEELSTFVHQPDSTIQPPWPQGTTNLKERDVETSAPSESNVTKLIKFAHVNKRKSDALKRNQLPSYPAAILLRTRTKNPPEIVPQSGIASWKAPIPYNQFHHRFQHQANSFNIPPAYLQMHGNANTPIRHPVPFQHSSLPKINNYYPNNFVQCAPMYRAVYPQNTVLGQNIGPPGICDVNPNINWPCTYPVASLIPPPPPPPHQIQDQICQNFTTIVPQTNENSIIGINNGGVVKKINIMAVPAASNIQLNNETDNKESVVKLESSEDNVALENTVSNSMTAGNIEDIIPVSTKKQMLEELDKLVEIDESFIKSDLKAQCIVYNDKLNEIPAEKYTTIKAGPLVKKIKLKQPCVSSNIPDRDKRIGQEHLSKGYSPPILPIPTYQNILSQLPEPPKYPLDSKPNKSKDFCSKSKYDKKENDINKEKVKKISLDEYKKRIFCKRDAVHTSVGGQQRLKIVGSLGRNKKEIVDGNDQYIDQDLGYDSDTTVKS